MFVIALLRLVLFGESSVNFGQFILVRFSEGAKNLPLGKNSHVNDRLGSGA